MQMWLELSSVCVVDSSGKIMREASLPPEKWSSRRYGFRADGGVKKLRQVDVLSSQGKSVAEASRSIGVTEVTYYRWRSEYGV